MYNFKKVKFGKEIFILVLKIGQIIQRWQRIILGYIQQQIFGLHLVHGEIQHLIHGEIQHNIQHQVHGEIQHKINGGQPKIHGETQRRVHGIIIQLQVCPWKVCLWMVLFIQC